MRLAPLFLLYVVVCAVAQPGGDPVRDEPALLAAAERLVAHGQLAGTGTDPDQRAFLWHGPGLVVLLGPFVAFDVPLVAVRFLEPLLLGVAIALFHRLLRRRLDVRPALLWTYALGLYAPFFIVLGTIQKEPLSIVLVVAGMLALTYGLECGRRSALAGAGLALGALAMVRLEYGWVALALLVIAALWWATHRQSATSRRLVAVAAVAVVACVPWLAYTHAKTARAMYWSSSSGLSLFWMSPTLPGETGQWHSPVRVYRDPALAPYRPLFRALDEVHPLHSDLQLRRRAVANVRADPMRYARNVAANTSRLLFFAPVRSRHPPLGYAMYALFNGLLLLAVIWAARMLWRRRRSLPPQTAPVALFAALAVAVHLPVSASPRMLLPVVPALLWLVVVAFANGVAPTTAGSAAQAVDLKAPRRLDAAGR